jgi:hypothetical protein
MMRGGATALGGMLIVAAALLLNAPRPAAQQPATSPVHVLEDVIEDLGRTSALAIDRPKHIAAFVFAALKDRVRVYPTENYYYFRFVHDGTVYTGNFRLDATDRDSGKIHFAYAEELGDWKPDGPEYYEVLDAASGFAVEPLRPLVYRVTHRNKSVVFELNDLADVTPPAGATSASETFIGPIFDESALRFFLFYERPTKSFLYVLDETARPPEHLDARKTANRILVGRRTAFAFYRDHRLDRKILIGALSRNVRLNTYFDGPFDQLPENFIKGETFRDAVIDARPDLKGRIGRLGHFPSASRYAPDPYMHYEKLADLDRVHVCATARQRQPTYYRCFVNPPR